VSHARNGRNERRPPSKYVPIDQLSSLNIIKNYYVISNQQFIVFFINADASSPLIVIGSDTMIQYGGEIFGKPKDIADARRMLTL
jgi:predicted house-cleaning NTP pyrophosphatase (Maf/HAM1 superfamily)